MTELIQKYEEVKAQVEYEVKVLEEGFDGSVRRVCKEHNLKVEQYINLEAQRNAYPDIEDGVVVTPFITYYTKLYNCDVIYLAQKAAVSANDFLYLRRRGYYDMEFVKTRKVIGNETEVIDMVRMKRA